MDSKKYVMSWEAVLEKINEPGFNISACAKEIGVHPNTLRYLRNGKSEGPSWGVLKKLSDYLEKEV